MDKKLFLLRGLPGSGKSSLAKSLSNATTGHVEADMYFINDKYEYKFDASVLKEAHQWCKGVVEGWMSPETGYLDTIIVSNTFTQEWEMKPYYELAEKYGYVVFSLVVENRHGGINEHGVPDETLEKMENRFQLKLR
jgi:predicted kinase